METQVECQVCGGPLMLLGCLGRLLHLRCRDCGLGFSRPDDEADEAGVMLGAAPGKDNPPC